MKALRDELYFEARVIDGSGLLRWYGEVYKGEGLLEHVEETVYIRDTSRELLVYTLESDEWRKEQRVEAVFTLICRLPKYNDRSRYGRRYR